MGATTTARAFRVHAWVFAAGACALSAANWFTGPPWWSFWPLGAWGVALAVHYMVRKAGTVSEAWVEERTAELHSKSYDASHIDRIAADHDGGTAQREEKRIP
jgi:hypothetical protein